jgi:ABC-2 type transport system ATP-binding protein
MTPVLEFRDIARAFQKDKPVLDGVTFSMQEAEVVGLLGRNGAGKTTLLRIAMGMLFAQRGSVRVFGMSPQDDPVAVKKRIGYVAEDQTFPPFASVGDLISLHEHLFPKWDNGLARELMDRFSLTANSRIGKISKGQARQVALLCAVCHRPELLLLDEPAGGLDPAARREFLETSIQLLNREGTAILFSSHYMPDVERIGGRVVVLADGKVRLDHELDSLREGYCIAMLPRISAPNSSVLERIPGCLRVRPVREDWHAVFEGSPDAVQSKVRQAIGANGVHCVTVPLEELFIELLGGERA